MARQRRSYRKTQRDILLIQFAGTPLCTDEWSYELWREVAVPGMVYCRDCTPEYQREKLAQHRCTQPNVEFVWRPGNGEQSGYQECVGTRSAMPRDEPVLEPEPPMFRPTAESANG